MATIDNIFKDIDPNAPVQDPQVEKAPPWAKAPEWERGYDYRENSPNKPLIDATKLKEAETAAIGEEDKRTTPTLDEHLEIRRRRVENNATVVYNDLETAISNFAKADNDSRKRGAANKIKTLIDQYDAGGTVVPGQALAEAVLDLSDEKRELLKAALAIADKIPGKNQSKDSYKELEDKVAIVRTAMDNKLWDELGSSSNRSEVEGIINQYAFSALGLDKEKASNEFIRRLIENNKAAICNRSSLNELLSSEGFSKDKLTQKPLRDFIESLETDLAAADRVDYEALGKALHVALPKGPISNDNAKAEYNALVEAVFANTDYDSRFKIIQGYHRAAHPDGKELSQEKSQTGVYKELQIGEGKLFERLASIRLENTSNNLARMFNEQDNIYTEIGINNPKTLRKQLFDTDAAANGLAVVSIATAKDPAKLLSLMASAEGEKVDSMISKLPESTQRVLRAANSGNRISLRAEVLEWSIDNNHPDVFKLICNSIPNGLARVADREHLKLISERHHEPEAKKKFVEHKKKEMEDAAKDYIDYEEYLEFRKKKDLPNIDVGKFVTKKKDLPNIDVE